MQINKELCVPDKCNLECIDACARVRGEKAPLLYNQANGYPHMVGNGCTLCFACIRACPFGAITTEKRKEHPREKHAMAAENGHERPYEVAETFKQFPEADMIFARVGGDPDFEHYQNGPYSGADAMIAKNVLGYSRIEHTLGTAGWKLYDSRHLVIPDRLTTTEVTEPLSTDPVELTHEIKKAATHYGADLVGITSLDRNWIYSSNRSGEPYDIPESINKAIVIAIEMDYDGIGTSPAYGSSAATSLGYSKMAFVEIELTAFIKRLGYNAIPCGNDITISVPLAIDAGLGQFGRHGLLITKKFGPRVRIAKVLTDMPLTDDSPDLG
ncbi:MAG: hypothetical protein ACTSV2_00430, partial [Candidatus Thorarchaeota archaeon]